MTASSSFSIGPFPLFTVVKNSIEVHNGAASARARRGRFPIFFGVCDLGMEGGEYPTRIEGRGVKHDHGKTKMHTPTTDAALAALPDPDLKARLARTDWENDPEYVTDEQVFRLFRLARKARDMPRTTLFMESLCRRLLERARAFAVRSGIYLGLMGGLDDAGQELAQFVWDSLTKSPTDAVHAERAFGQLFTRRAIDFQRKLLAKKRKLQINFEDPKQFPEDEDPDVTIREVSSLRQDTTPEQTYQKKQRYLDATRRLQSVLTQDEFSVFVMLNQDEMKVKDIAVALGVTTRTINTYKNKALAKIAKEFSNDTEHS
jgi:RNA polymerase sigma factor (sigma-70 family)